MNTQLFSGTCISIMSETFNKITDLIKFLFFGKKIPEIFARNEKKDIKKKL
jgi:hypothetical protein